MNGIDALPEALRSRVAQQWQACTQSGAGDLPQALLDSLPWVWAASSFVARHCLRDTGLLAGLIESGDLQRAYAPGELTGRLRDEVATLANQPELMRTLRRCRNRELVRIAWRDLAGWASLEETLSELSSLADACIESALGWLERDLAARHGAMPDANGQPARLVVLGMGKLGGHELNFSSDVDLIYIHEGQGASGGAQSLDAEEYFTRLARSLGQVLSQVTGEGFVYRVDTLLRPFGKSGPLVMHADTAEQYYQTHGREWERYALIKARPVAGDLAGGERLLQVLRPFIYRRYLDYGAFESLREMKALIEQQLHRSGFSDNIKLGPGGIREIEFVVQAFQLIRGGQDRQLQQRSLMPALGMIERKGLLPGYAVQALREAYVFLRRAENRLQAWDDQQTHELPQDDERRQALALAMGFADWAAFLPEMNRHRRRVHEQFEQVFAAPQTGGAEPDQGDRVAATWEEAVGDAEALEILTAQGLPPVAATPEFLAALRRSPIYRGLGRQGRRRFSQLLPLLFGAVRERERADAVLLRVFEVLESIAGRTTYLALLVESPVALSQLVALCAASPWITHQISRHPVLLDELLDPRALYRTAVRVELEQELDAAAALLALEDLEAQMDLLRRLRQAWVLRVAAADVSGSLPLMIVSDRLTDIAEILLTHALKIAWQQMRQRHGRPLREDGSEAGFSIIAFGKLGGIELGYASDLDLVFVHDGSETCMTDGPRPIDHGTFFTRLGQKIIHVLSAQMASGIAYAVDLQLRPSGNSGLLVTSLDGYRNYLMQKAWTWEHQALVRARPVAGTEAVGEAFLELRRDTLCRPRDAAQLRAEIRTMREKMRDTLGDRTSGYFDIKHGRGGITDIEFMVQYAVLRDAAVRPELVQFSDNIRQLDALYASGALSGEDVSLMGDAYRAYRKHVHVLALQEQPTVVADTEFTDYRARVSRLWDAMLGDPEMENSKP